MRRQHQVVTFAAPCYMVAEPTPVGDLAFLPLDRHIFIEFRHSRNPRKGILFQAHPEIPKKSVDENSFAPEFCWRRHPAGEKGMSKESLTRIFEPFFSTKGITGTGLGLWVTQGVFRNIKAGRRSAAVKTNAATEQLSSCFFPTGRNSWRHRSRNLSQKRPTHC
jgi:hypothetical protein